MKDNNAKKQVATKNKTTCLSRLHPGKQFRAMKR